MSQEVDLIKKIVSELEALHITISVPGGSNRVREFPRTIAVGDRGSIEVNREIDEHIFHVANLIKSQVGDASKHFTNKEWNDYVRSQFGPLLASVDFAEDRDTVSQRLFDELKEKIEAARAWQLRGREHSFGCTLFTTQKLAPFSFGPVTFEHREDWIQRQGGEKGLSKTAMRRTLQAWQGKPLRSRKPTRDSIHEKDAIRVAAECRFVCSVTTQGLAMEASKEKALICARLALAIVSLFWQSSSRQLESMNLVFDRSVMHQRSYVRVPQIGILSGSRLKYHSLSSMVTDQDWQKDLTDVGAAVPIWAEIFRFNTDFENTHARPNLMMAFTHALFWFHEACRCDMPQVSVAYFSSCLDALSGGGKSGGIVQLLERVLGRSREKEIFTGGPTLKQAVNRIYSDGRSRVFHGNSPEFHDDWTPVKAYAEQLARFALWHCFDWAARNPGVDDPKSMSSAAN